MEVLQIEYLLVALQRQVLVNTEGERKEGREGGKKGGREGGREEREGGREGGREEREGGRDRWINVGREGGREGRREGGREGRREGGRKGEVCIMIYCAPSPLLRSPHLLPIFRVLLVLLKLLLPLLLTPRRPHALDQVPLRHAQAGLSKTGEATDHHCPAHHPTAPKQPQAEDTFSTGSGGGGGDWEGGREGGREEGWRCARCSCKTLQREQRAHCTGARELPSGLLHGSPTHARAQRCPVTASTLQAPRRNARVHQRTTWIVLKALRHIYSPPAGRNRPDDATEWQKRLH